MVKAITIITLRQTNSVFRGWHAIFGRCVRVLCCIFCQENIAESLRFDNRWQAILIYMFGYVWQCPGHVLSFILLGMTSSHLMALSSQICPPCVIGHFKSFCLLSGPTVDQPVVDDWFLFFKQILKHWCFILMSKISRWLHILCIYIYMYIYTDIHTHAYL